MKKSFARTAVLMGAIILVSKLMGLGRDILTAGTYGTSVFATAYETASKLPITIFDFVLGGVVTSAFIPVYSSISEKRGRDKAAEFASSYLNLILAVTAVIALFGILFAPALVSLIAPGLGEECRILAVSLTRIMFPMVIFVGIAFSFVGFLQSEGEYNIPALISLVSNLIMVGYLLISGRLFSDLRTSVTGLSVAMLIGWAAQAFVQLPSVKKHGFKYRLTAPLITPDTTRAAKNALPILAATWTSPVCTLINTSVASEIEGGRAINALAYANRLYIIIVGLFSFVATNLLFPYFARAAVRGDVTESDRLTRTSIKVLTFIIAPISAGVAVLAEPFVRLIYERRTFTASDTAITAEALRFYAAGMLFAAICEVLTKSFFASEQTKLPMIASVVSIAFNAAVIILWKNSGIYLPVGGIALVSGISAAVNMAVNLTFAVRRKMIIPCRADILDIAKSVLSAVIMGFGVHFINGLTHGMPSLISFGISVLSGVIIYAILTAITKSEELHRIFSLR